MEKAFKILVFGEVQGVFFRASAKESAEALGVSGWAKNNPDGSVEIWAEGQEENLQNFLDWCYNGSEKVKPRENMPVTSLYRAESSEALRRRTKVERLIREGRRPRGFKNFKIER